MHSVEMKPVERNCKENLRGTLILSKFTVLDGMSLCGIVQNAARMYDSAAAV